MKKLYIAFSLLCSLPFASRLFGQQTFTTSAAFLRVSPDIRGAALGDAGIANTPDAYATFRNISKLAFDTSKGGVTASYTPWMQNASDGIYLGAVGGYIKLGSDQALTASFRYFHIGEAKLADENGMSLGSFSPNEFAADLGYSRKLSARFGMGIGLRYINSRIASGNLNGDNYQTGSAVAGDISAYYTGLNTAGNGLTLGLNVSNLGSKISYTSVANSGGFLPATFGIGAGYTVSNEGHRFTFLAELNKALVPLKPSDSATIETYKSMGVAESWTKSFKSGNGKAMQYSAGIEYAWDEMLFLRVGGLADGRSRMAGDNRFYLTLGAGVKYKAFKVDFAYMGGNSAGSAGLPGANTIRFGVAYNVFHSAR